MSIKNQFSGIFKPETKIHQEVLKENPIPVTEVLNKEATESFNFSNYYGTDGVNGALYKFIGKQVKFNLKYKSPIAAFMLYKYDSEILGGYKKLNNLPVIEFAGVNKFPEDRKIQFLKDITEKLPAVTICNNHVLIALQEVHTLTFESVDGHVTEYGISNMGNGYTAINYEPYTGSAL